MFIAVLFLIAKINPQTITHWQKKGQIMIYSYKSENKELKASYINIGKSQKYQVESRGKKEVEEHKQLNTVYVKSPKYKP